MAALLPLLKFQMIAGMFGGGGRGRGGFNFSKIIGMMMNLAMIPIMMKALGGISL